MTVNDYIGKEFTHPALGKVIVDSRVEGSRTLVNVTCIDKGAGWNEKKQAYTGVTTHGKDHKGQKTTSWVRGENKQYLDKDQVHIKTLN